MALSTRYHSVEGEMLYETKGQRVDYLPDALGSITASTTPGAPNAVENTYRMKPYGATLVKTGVGGDSRFRWLGTIGYRRTNLFRPGIYVRARHYSQEDGRWTTVDPIWPNELAYVYVGGKPVVLIDYAGLMPLGGLLKKCKGGSDVLKELESLLTKKCRAAIDKVCKKPGITLSKIDYVVRDDCTYWDKTDGFTWGCTWAYPTERVPPGTIPPKGTPCRSTNVCFSTKLCNQGGKNKPKLLACSLLWELANYCSCSPGGSGFDPHEENAKMVGKACGCSSLVGPGGVSG